MAWPLSTGQRDDVERLFSAEAPGPVPISSSAGYQPAGLASPGIGSGGGATSPPLGIATLSTLDEPVWHTFKRDLNRIWKNLVMVVFPFKDRSQQSAALRNWDLWGPMVFMLTLAVTLSAGSKDASTVFSTVFAVVSVGAVVLTVNVVLLGGTIGFFQSLCLLGYCLFPMDIAAIVCAFVKLMLVRWIVVGVMIVWASWASIPFIAGAVPVARKALAIYPLVLLYVCVGWIALIA